MTQPTFRPPVARPLHPIGAGNVPPGEFRVTRSFGDLTFPQHGPHDGLDVGNGRIHDPIVAMAPGTVTYAQFKADAGGAAIVRLDHGDGWSSGNAHMDRIDVSVGQKVAAGHQVGILGSTGWVSGAHLHFDITRNGTRLDPWPLLQLEEDDMRYPRPMKPLALVTIAAGNNLRRTPSLTAEAYGKAPLAADAQVGVCAVVGGDPWKDKGSDWLWVGFKGEMWCVHRALAPGVTATGELGLSVGTGVPPEELARVQAAARSAGRIEGRSIAAKAAAEAPVE